MAISRFLPGSWRGYRSGSSAPLIFFSRSLRSTQEPTNAFEASPDFNSSLAKAIQLPGLSRLVVSTRYVSGAQYTDSISVLFALLTQLDSTLKHIEKRSSSQKTGIIIYTDDSTATSFGKLSDEISRDVQQPDNDGLLSTLRYSYGLAKAVLFAWPSARLALIEQGMAGDIPKARRLRTWTIRGVLSRPDLQSTTKGIPSFILRITTSMDGVLSNIGPSAAASNTQSLSALIIDLHLRSKALPPFVPLGESADESTQPVEDLVNKLVDDLWSSLRGRQFTSIVSWNEAAVMHLKESFGRSKFDQYLELENMRVVSERTAGAYVLRWIHEPQSLTANLQAFSVTNPSLTQVLKLRHKGSPQGIENENETATMSVSTCYLCSSTS